MVITMKTAGIIAEYNPFHSGHAWHIAKTREAGFTHIIAVMSGNVVQRGDLAILDSRSRAQAAIFGGADLVVELPPPYCCGSAKDFAAAGVHIIKCLGSVDALSFGSECGDIRSLSECADEVSQSYSGRVAEKIAQGLTYPQALAAAYPEFKDILGGANNTLALEYLIALKGSGISGFTVPRTAPHDTDGESSGFASASAIRKMILSGEPSADYRRFLLSDIDEKDVSSIADAEKAILYKLASMKESDILNAPYTGDGIAQRLIKYRMTANSLEELYSLVKTRNVTHARVRRALLLAAIGADKRDLSSPPPYARVLAANKRGLEILAGCKIYSSIPVSTSLAELAAASKQAERCAGLTEIASRLRYMARQGGIGGYVSEYSRRFSLTE